MGILRVPTIILTERTIQLLRSSENVTNQDSRIDMFAFDTDN